MQWDDLRYVLAVHRGKSLAGAARALNISHVTVFRRIEVIEKDLGVRLFDRKRHGYVPTALGVEFLRQAEQVEEQILALERSAWRHDSQISGTVRITATDTVSATVLPGMLAKLRQAHPQIRLELVISGEILNIAKRDADIAIRHTTAPPEMLIGHRLVPVAYAIYGSKNLAVRYRRKRDLTALPWVSQDDSPVEYRFIKWIRDNGCESRVVLRCNSFMALAAAVKAGMGVGILSCFTAASVGGLVRLSEPIKDIELQYWILTHPELRDVARVATVYAFLRSAFAELRPLFSGENTT